MKSIRGIHVIDKGIHAFQCTCLVRDEHKDHKRHEDHKKITGTPDQMSTISPTPKPNEYHFALQAVIHKAPKPNEYRILPPRKTQCV